MQYVVRFLLLTLVVLAVGCSRDPATQSNRLVESGNKFYDKAKYKEASMQYRRAIQKYAKNGEAYYRLGLTSIKLTDLPSAAQAFRRALDVKADNTDAATKLADIYWLAFASDPRRFEKLLPEIEELSNNLLKRDPKSYDGLRLSGYMALAKKNADGKPDLTTALARFEQANQAKPDQPELSVVMVQTLMALGRRDDAEKLAKDFLSRQKNFPPMYDQLLAMYLARNQLPEAEQILKDKISNNPRQENFYLQLAGFYTATQRTAEAESTLQRLISNPKDFPMARLTVGRFFNRLRDHDRARKEFEEGIKTSSKDNKPSYQKALVELLAVSGKNQEARALIDEVLKENPKDTQAIEIRSSLRLRTGDPAEIQAAINELQGLVTKSPDNAVYRFELGKALMAKGKDGMDLARVQFDESIRLRPDFIPPKLLLSQLLSEKKEYGKALQLADEILRGDPGNFGGRLLRSSALIGIGETEKAKLELDGILKVAPNSPDAKFQLGMIKFREKNYKEADEIFREMRASNPSDNRGLVGHLETQVAQNDLSGAISTMEAEIQRAPDRQDYQLFLANTLVRAQRYDDAIRQFKQLIDKSPKSSDLYGRLGETYRFKGDLNSAIESFRTATALDPNDHTSMLRLALLLDGLGRRDESKTLYEKVIKIRPEEGAALNNLAYIKAEEGTDLDQALSLAQRAKQVYPQDPNIADTLGWVYIRKNLSEDAIRVYREIVGKNPTNPTYRYHLAMALHQKGDRANARKECEVALQNNPSKEESAKIRELLGKLG